MKAGLLCLIRCDRDHDGGDLILNGHAHDLLNVHATAHDHGAHANLHVHFHGHFYAHADAHHAHVHAHYCGHGAMTHCGSGHLLKL